MPRHYVMIPLALFTIVSTTWIFAQDPPLATESLAKAKTYESLKEALKEPGRVYKLRLSYSPLKSLPAKIDSLVNLQVLDLAGTALTQLPKEIGSLRNLEILDLSANKLTALPDEIRELQNLKELNLGYNGFGTIPPGVFALSNLRQLSLVKIGLKEIPPEIGGLRNLVYLTAIQNGLKRLPKEIGALEMLESLYLGSNGIESLPESIENLKSLEILDLSANRLTEIPSGITKLERLRDLDLTGNALMEMPPDLRSLLRLPMPRGWRNMEKENPNRLFSGEGKPLFGPEGVIQTMTDRPLPSIAEISELVERTEAMERGGYSGEAPDELELERASAGLAVHLEQNPDDVGALILTARLGGYTETSQSQVFFKGEAESAPDAPYFPLHAALDRAIQLEPGNAEAHFWKARLYGIVVPDLSTGVMTYRSLDLERAIEFGAKAVALESGNNRYREALALYFAAAEKFTEAMDTLRPVDDGKHPMYSILSDFERVPLPSTAKYLPENSRSFAELQANRGRYENYPLLRVRMYAIPGPGSQVEAFFRLHWPGFSLFKMDRTKTPEGATVTIYGQILLVRGDELKPIESKARFEQLEAMGRGGGFNLSVVEFKKPTQEVRDQFGAGSADPFSIITIMNDH